MTPEPQAIPTLTPELQTLYRQVTDLRSHVFETTSGLSEPQFAWTPSPETWSVAQCLDHLNRVASLLLPRLESAVEQLRARGLRSEGPFHYGFAERWFIRILGPNPPLKVPVPYRYTPAVAAPGETVTEFLALQERLLRCLAAADGLHLTRLKVASPVNRFMRLSVGAWLHATVAHERYHWQQALEVTAHGRFPAQP